MRLSYYYVFVFTFVLGSIYIRAWNMMEETFLMNVVKERLCYVSLNFMQDLELTK